MVLTSSKVNNSLWKLNRYQSTLLTEAMMGILLELFVCVSNLNTGHYYTLMVMCKSKYYQDKIKKYIFSKTKCRNDLKSLVESKSWNVYRNKTLMSILRALNNFYNQLNVTDVYYLLIS